MEGRITANGVETAYRVDGPDDGPVVLLANSLLSNYGMWDPQIPALAERYRVLRYDQRGHGGSEATPPPYDFDMLVEPTLETCFSAAFRDSNPDDVARAGDMMATTSLDGFVGCCNAIEATDQAPQLTGIAVPTLVMVGADDPMTTVEDARRLHDGIVGSRLVVLEGAAHFSNIEQPDAFNAALRGFLDEN